ncbi:MAG: Rv3654c family TadE-like protein [Acidimicrobiales bacterium]
MGVGERGSVVPLVAVAVLLAGLVILGLGRLGQAATASATARTAADAAALGGAAEGLEVARRLAAANGGEMSRFERIGRDVRVTVRVGRASAVARATVDAGGQERGQPAAGSRMSLPLRR